MKDSNDATASLKQSSGVLPAFSCARISGTTLLYKFNQIISCSALGAIAKSAENVIEFVARRTIELLLLTLPQTHRTMVFHRLCTQHQRLCPCQFLLPRYLLTGALPTVSYSSASRSEAALRRETRKGPTTHRSTDSSRAKVHYASIPRNVGMCDRNNLRYQTPLTREDNQRMEADSTAGRFREVQCMTLLLLRGERIRQPMNAVRIDLWLSFTWYACRPSSSVLIANVILPPEWPTSSKSLLISGPCPLDSCFCDVHRDSARHIGHDLPKGYEQAECCYAVPA